MKSNDLELLQYPIGHFQVPEIITDNHIEEWILVLDELPQRLDDLVKNLSSEQLETPYRPGGWTVLQVVHHIADSHHNSYTRFKWALTEEQPIIKAYDEKEWATLFDGRTAPIGLSLNYIRALHAKMVYLLKGLSPEALNKIYIHPNGLKEVSVKRNIGMYAWHSNHHYAHIYNLLQREGWL